MGQSTHEQTEIDPQALREARHSWAMFTEFTKFGIVGVVAILILMAVFVA